MSRMKGSKNAEKEPASFSLSDDKKLQIVADLLLELVAAEFNTRRRKKRCKTT